MATEQINVIEGDGSSDSITVTDDPVEDATVQAVRDAIGDETTASEQADSTVAATLLERVTALVDALTSGQADDEVRVALAADLLSGNIDIDVAEQSAGNIAVELAADSLTGSLDVDLAAQTSGPLDVSGSTVPTEQQTPIQLESSTGTNINPATEGKLEQVRSLLDGLDDALASVASDTLRTEQQSPVGVEDTSGTQIDPASNPEVRGGATLQDVVDAIDQGALAQIAATEEGTLLTDATTAQTTSVQTTTGYKGVLVFVNIDAISGTSPELTAKIQRQTPGGVTQDVLSTGTLSSTGLTTLQVHPSLTDSANERAGELLGRDWQVDVSLKTSAGDESYHYDIEYTYIE